MGQPRGDKTARATTPERKLATRGHQTAAAELASGERRRQHHRRTPTAGTRGRDEFGPESGGAIQQAVRLLYPTVRRARRRARSEPRGCWREPSMGKDVWAFRYEDLSIKRYYYISWFDILMLSRFLMPPPCFFFLLFVLNAYTAQPK